LVTWRQDETKLDETPYIYGAITTPFSSGLQSNYSVHTTIATAYLKINMPSSHSRIRAARHERQIARLKDTIGEKLGCSRFNYNDKSKNITQDLVKRSLSNIKNQYLALKIKTFKALQNTDLLQKNLMIIDDKKQVRQLAKVLIASSLNIFEIIFKS
jgi:hypothetical protein